MDTRVALIGIVVKNFSSANEINNILHSYGDYIIGRMGIPYKEKAINIISIAIDAPLDIINSLSGKLGQLDGVSTKTIYN
ncbi:MAG: iron-only hydrogenase system regulator [Clostridia bacterium]|nr:iron-only hydrogenase system regulator [Clostridia bacterium]